MRLKVLFSLFFFSLFLCTAISASAKESATKATENTFTLEVENDLISLQIEQSRSKEILSDLERMTGIKVNVFDGLPVYAIHSILEEIKKIAINPLVLRFYSFTKQMF